MADVLEINAETGEVVERSFTSDELAQRELDRIAFEKAETLRIVEEKAREDAKKSAISKLSTLGLNKQEIHSIIGVI